MAPVRKAKEWELRVAWADSGVADAPWKLLYVHCLYTGDQKEKGQPVPNHPQEWGHHHRLYTLGPIGWDLHYAPPNRLEVPCELSKSRGELSKSRGDRQARCRYSTEQLYCAVVPTPLAGTYELTIGDRESAVTATIPVEKAPVLSWTALLAPRKGRPSRVKSGEGPFSLARGFGAVIPAYREEPIFFHSDKTRARGEQALFAKSLPGQCTGQAGWRLFEEDGQSGILERMTPLRLTAKIAADKLLLHCKGFTPERLNPQFLAQWRINGKLVVADWPSEKKRIDESEKRLEDVLAEAKRENEESTVEIPQVLPAWLARRVKAGDKVALTVLYSPEACQEVFYPGGESPCAEHLDEQKGQCAQPVMSEPVTFTVTAPMLAKARAAAKAAAQLAAKARKP